MTAVSDPKEKKNSLEQSYISILMRRRDFLQDRLDQRGGMTRTRDQQECRALAWAIGKLKSDGHGLAPTGTVNVQGPTKETGTVL